MNVAPFSPQANSITISATGTASSTPLGATNTALNAAAASAVMRVINAGTGPIFFSVTQGNQTATVAASTPMLAGTVEVFSKPIGADTFNVISGGTSTVYVTCGEGQ